MPLDDLFQHLSPDDREAALLLLRVQLARRRRLAARQTDHVDPPTLPVKERTEKRCPRCDTVKPMDAFGVSITRPDGRQGHCRPCRRRGV